jgi:molybdenum cofactor guanylyltransferase
VKTAALILAGGLSSRMGSDKGLLKQEGQYWVGIIQQLIPVDVECFISVGKHNLEAYKEAGFRNLILDKEGLEDFTGPIKGILSGLEVFQAFDNLLVLPCDMIHLDAETIRVLIHQEKTSCYKVATQIQPMPMLLTCDCLQSLTNQNLENISLKKFLELQQCEYILSENPSLFLNRNTPL